MSDFGQIYLSIDGENISVSGNVTFNNLNLGERAFEANMDGTIRSSFTPMVATADIENLSACSIPIEELAALMQRCENGGDGINVLFGLSGGCSSDVKTITFANAIMGGTMSLDGSTGQVSGFSIGSADILINGVAIRDGLNA